jgi:4-nitrophenyl phosphatase
MAKLTDITHLIIDMDGVLYRGDNPLPGLREFFAFLRERPIPFVLATNNSTRTPQQRVEKLARMGVQIYPEEVLNSG